jgi:hypothetical protein
MTMNYLPTLTVHGGATMDYESMDYPATTARPGFTSVMITVKNDKGEPIANLVTFMPYGYRPEVGKAAAPAVQS